MSIRLDKEIADVLLEKDAVKVLATVDEKGIPHVVYKNSFHVDEEGRLVYLEIIETSRTNRNMVSSIWFGQKVAVNVLSKDKKSWQIKGKPVKAVISGPVFENYYVQVRKNLGDVDLSTVWIIEPDEVIDESFNLRRDEEEKEHPLLVHLDRLAK